MLSQGRTSEFLRQLGEASVREGFSFGNLYLRTGWNSVEDQERLMRHYTCACGRVMTGQRREVSRGRYSDLYYFMHCGGCGEEETVGFRVVNSAS